MIARAYQNAINGGDALRWRDALILSSLTAAFAVPAVVGLYIVKSALGINLMDGYSPLHDLLYRSFVGG